MKDKDKRNNGLTIKQTVVAAIVYVALLSLTIYSLL